jgi:nicotinamide-nucleotide amidase
MRCEVVAIGTELLLGILVDSNSAWIGEQLALAGIDSHFQVKVGDNLGRIEAAIRQGLERSDAIICCGGLGPTQDDITRDAIARVMGVAMRRDEAIAARIRKYFESRGRVMSENNLRQADIPVGAQPIAQMPGTAAGLVCPVGGKVIYAMPGVPAEMREMVRGTVLPDLRRRSGQAAVIRARVLRTWGMAESGLAEVLATRIVELDGLGNPTLAFQASGIDGIKVRIVAKCDDEATAARLLDAEEKLIRGLLGHVVFGVDEQTMETVVLDLLRRKGLTLAVAETVTGGLLSARMSAADPAMEVFRGASVTPDAANGEAPAEQRAAAAAAKVRSQLGAGVGLAAVAPATGEGHPPGAVFLAADIGGETRTEKVMLTPDRRRMREFSVISLLNLLRRALAS